MQDDETYFRCCVTNDADNFRMNKSGFSRNNDVTMDEVKSLPLFAPFSDAQAIKTIQTVKRFRLSQLKAWINK
ncbi:hypothetical protein DF947_21590 [Pedobacter paludis]|uniref:Uncharacterized protein n=1 Tax=Pedobacter paludis TaxID=2203212 RepID=A0A317ES56_9SPHI|nr:hypothetical protein DF947_21590 [Pedobacter paludis]